MKIKTLIADDEAHVREELSYIISEMDGFELIPSVGTGTQVLKSLTEHHPALLLLDIEMPGLNGIEVGEIISRMQNPPYIIYVTAYDTYALDAFRVNAVGYILKPISKLNVVSKLEMVLKMIASKSEPVSESDPVSPRKTDRISYKLDDRYIFFEQEELVYAYAKEREVYLRVKDQDYLYNQTLSKLEEKLDPTKFFRCHRNYIVNVSKIKEVIPWFNGSYLLLMNEKKGSNIPVSRNQAKQLKQILKL